MADVRYRIFYGGCQNADVRFIEWDFNPLFFGDFIIEFKIMTFNAPLEEIKLALSLSKGNKK